ncbi:MAG TPA: epoxyqueuosine reductase QueH [Candidatus Avacidaminococcus intestinavium]|uniref:Epoxyqueuosine reductase QueH n=1 Tax=Candidatus Avacidaminococcus intestinavium TaxID=2840684 RepID=A0A9D1SMA2_9FIRM|nr:epoxyqueuosine reductase QueH [Candidatus Avacidaminococcus intestinavium]
MKILLHTCCGPCSIFPTNYLKAQGHQFSMYYFNPNIHPYKEFKRRLNTLREYATLKKYDLIVDKSYPLEECVRGMLEEPTIRCAYCYRVRLQQAADFAKANGYDCFSTTLLVSPFQKHDLIKEIASTIAEVSGIPFYYYDFRIGYEEGVSISKELEMYRQGYCGCIFSERDRYEKKRKVKEVADA